MTAPDWAAFRARFPALRRWTYLNSAAAGPLVPEVAAAACRPTEQMLAGGDEGWQEQVADMAAARRDLAALCGCAPEELAFTRNTSHSTVLAAQALWDAGARTAVALEDEFPASTLPFLNRGFDVRFVRADAGRYPAALLEQALRGRDVLVASHVMYRTGHANDPAELGRVAAACGARLVLCATQSVGALQVDFRASGAAFMTGNSHKWLCGGYGGGFLAVRRDLLDALPFPAAGWLSNRHAGLMRNDVLDLPREAKVLEMGTAPVGAILAAGEAARLWLSVGPGQVQERIRTLTARLRERLIDAGFAVRLPVREELSGITVLPCAEAAAVCDALRARGIATTPRGAGVRLSLHAFNDESDSERAVEALRELLRPA